MTRPVNFRSSEHNKMSTDTWRLSRIQDELDRLDFTSSENTQAGLSTSGINDKIAMDSAAITIANFVGDEGYSDDNESLPPYPEVGDDSVIHDYGDFPTPVPAQIGIVRPLPGATKQQTPLGDIYSKTYAKPIKDVYDESVVAQMFTEQYDSLGKVKPKFELAKIPDGYINMNSPTTIVPKRVAPPPPPDMMSAAAHARPSSDVGRTFSEIIEIRSPARSMSMAMAHQLSPISQEQGHSRSPETRSRISSAMPDQIHSPRSPAKRGSREFSWTEMDTRSSPSKGVLPGDMTGFQNNSIMKTSASSSLTEHEILQVEMFYSSHKTQVFVGQCTADLYYGSIKNITSADNFYSSGSDTLSNWKLIKPGIPVLLLDSGESRRERKLHLVVAERGTGFALWKDEFNHLTDYQARESLFHTMHLSTDHSKLAGFKFQDAVGATDFLQKIKAIITNPEMEDVLNLSGKKKKKDKRRLTLLKSKKKLPNKTAISAPCCFTHITNLDRTDGLGVLDIAAASKEQNS